MRYTNLFAGALLMTTMTVAADSDLIVHIHDKVGVATLEMASAKRLAVSQMAKAGISVRFVDCKRNPCQDAQDPRVFVISILDRVPVQKQTALGYALPFSRRCNEANLNYTLIIKTSPVQPEHLLGTVIVHELAHLLFHSTAHGEGLMKERWTAQDIRGMGENRFAFSAEQSAELRAGLQARFAATLVAVNTPQE